MFNFLVPYMEYIQLLANLVLVLTLGATVVVQSLGRLAQFKPGVQDFSSKLLKFLAWLPTFGINPRTKQLEEIVLNYKKEI